MVERSMSAGARASDVRAGLRGFGRGLLLIAAWWATACSESSPVDTPQEEVETQRSALAAHAEAERAEIAEAIKDRYIVVLREGAARSPASPTAAAVPDVAQALSAAHGGNVERTYQHALRGMSVTLTPAQLARMRSDSRVDYIVPDAVTTVEEDQTDPPWGLDRIDQRNLPLNATYTYLGQGTNVHAYIIDTGIRQDHTEFAGRVGQGHDSYDDDDDPTDCHGHGTHVAGTVMGTTWGVAKAATVHGVRVLSCSGNGTVSDVIAGIDWVTANHVAPAVANISLGFPVNQALNDAVTNSHNAGVSYAVSGGNDNYSACNKSPASTPEAFTVGATDSTDTRASFSNFGTCLDIFAPGVSVESADYSSTTASSIKSGTSMSSPHVAGVAALYRGANPTATTDDVREALLAQATVGVVQNPGTDSPNLMLYMGDIGGDNLSQGRLDLDGGGTCNTTLTVGLVDADLEGTGSHAVMLTTDTGDAESLTLIEDPANLGSFEATVDLVSGAPAPADGIVQTEHGVEVTVTYEDADDGATGPATVVETQVLDCEAPTLSNVHALSISGSAAIVGADASEPASLMASWGTSCDALDNVTSEGSLSLTPTTALIGLDSNTQYFYALTATDEWGNSVTDDNGGACYSLTTDDTAFSETFEGGTGVFTVESGLWHASTACASTQAGHSIPGTFYYGQDSTCDFNTGATTSGTARSIAVPVDLDNSELTFNYFLGGESSFTYDRASVEVAVDGGTPTVVASNFGVGVALTVNSGAWQAATVDLSTLGSGGATIELVLRFNSVDSVSNTGAGFYVDDMEITLPAAECESDADCDDGVACTVDLCDLESSTCSNSTDDTLCDDGLFCTGQEVCTVSGCQSGAPPSCDDGVSCTVDSCDESADSCLSVPDDSLCDNGAYCDGAEQCDATLDCVVGTPPCSGQCDEEQDQCLIGCDDSIYEAETMEHSTGGSTSGGWNIWSNGYAAFDHDFDGGPTDMIVTAAGDFAGGAWPNMTVTVGGVQVYSTTVSQSAWTDYEFTFDAPVGMAEVRVNFTNDYYQNGEDRNLRLDKVTVVCTGEVEPICGDGVVDPGEECDDGNTDPGDGCDASCLIEPFCGDGTLDPGEECDDGNNDPGDGCDESCNVEPICGDGVVDPGEECDDGNTDPGDGCDESCQLEPICGDGVVDPGEECDDGNTVPGDGCDETCNLETTCGDGILEPGEECDDGNTDPGDGCDAECNLEPVCGDGVVDPGEECDDGNTVPGDGCDASCQLEPFCGDGVVDPGEECDDGNTVPGDGCDASCLLEPTCDDGEQNGEETDVDCGGPVCGACEDGQMCDVAGDCTSGYCDSGICGPPPSGDLVAEYVINNDWGSGYCGILELTNNASQSTTSWQVSADIGGGTLGSAWNANFSSSTGEISMTPLTWNSVIAPGTTNTSIGFCVNRPGGDTSSTPEITSSSGNY